MPKSLTTGKPAPETLYVVYGDNDAESRVTNKLPVDTRFALLVNAGDKVTAAVKATAARLASGKDE